MFGPFPPGWASGPTGCQSRPAVFCKLQLANPVIRVASVKEPHLCLMLFTRGGFKWCLISPLRRPCPLALLVLMCEVWLLWKLVGWRSCFAAICEPE